MEKDQPHTADPAVLGVEADPPKERSDGIITIRIPDPNVANATRVMPESVILLAKLNCRERLRIHGKPYYEEWCGLCSREPNWTCRLTKEPVVMSRDGYMRDESSNDDASCSVNAKISAGVPTVTTMPTHRWLVRDAHTAPVLQECIQQTNPHTGVSYSWVDVPTVTMAENTTSKAKLPIQDIIAVCKAYEADGFGSPGKFMDEIRDILGLREE